MCCVFISAILFIVFSYLIDLYCQLNQDSSKSRAPGYKSGGLRFKSRFQVRIFSLEFKSLTSCHVILESFNKMDPEGASGICNWYSDFKAGHTVNVSRNAAPRRCEAEAEANPASRGNLLETDF